jgi:hypothetical protein
VSAFRTVPGAPFWRLPRGGPLPAPTPFLFSFERHALERWLQFAESRRGARLADVLVPDYMCHEVVASLRAAGRTVSYYPLGPGFEPDVERLAGLLAPRRGRAAVMACHFYGRRIRAWDGLLAAGRAADAPLAEDCAHRPFPEPGAPDADVRLHTFRKTYGVPYGATALLREGQAAFNGFVEEVSAPRADRDGAGLLRWGARELAKRAAIAARLPLRRSYRDLSQDPLKPFESVHPWAAGLLRAGDPERARRVRLGNLARYAAGAAAFDGWAEPLAFDPARDVPYQLLLTLAPGLSPRAAIAYFLERGVSALEGLALPHDVLAGLAPEHPYRRQLALPLHQDVGPDDVAYVLETARAFRRESGT